MADSGTGSGSAGGTKRIVSVADDGWVQELDGEGNKSVRYDATLDKSLRRDMQPKGKGSSSAPPPMKGGWNAEGGKCQGGKGHGRRPESGMGSVAEQICAELAEL